MDLIEALATAAFFALLAWVVIEIGWRDPKAFGAMSSDSEAFARTSRPERAPAELASVGEEATPKVLSFPRRTPRVPRAVDPPTVAREPAERRLEETP
jgi:hypothetical protein